jgi:hypothetical protein
MYFPEDGMKNDGPMIFFQLHGTPDTDNPEEGRNPPAALTIQGDGDMRWEYTYDPSEDSSQNNNIDNNRKSGKFGNLSNVRGEWVDFVWHSKVDWQGNGLVEGWMNGNQFLDDHNVAFGYNDDHGPYPSFGQYWWKPASYQYDHDHWLYMDEIRVGNATAGYNDVVPGAGNSNLTIPEPASLSLFLGAGVLVGYRRRRC